MVTNDFHEHGTKNKLKNIMLLFSMIFLCFLNSFMAVKTDWISSIWRTQIKIALQYLLNMKALKTK